VERVKELDKRERGATGFTCPQCGGALWEHQDEQGLAFVCRIDDRFTAAELWIDHCAQRNTALKEAERLLAENAALARRLTAWSVENGIIAAAAALEEEAAEDDRLRTQVRSLWEGLRPPPQRDN
jgi:two-component system, chemotaxis family, protein-glutamate methylesterase/glutaminase